MRFIIATILMFMLIGLIAENNKIEARKRERPLGSQDSTLMIRSTSSLDLDTKADGVGFGLYRSLPADTPRVSHYAKPGSDSTHKFELRGQLKTFSNYYDGHDSVEKNGWGISKPESVDSSGIGPVLIKFHRRPSARLTITYSDKVQYKGLYLDNYRFIIVDTPGRESASRDACGNWVIADTVRAMEIMYEIIINKYK